MHQIRYFLAVCDELNFTRAAERCNVTQPALTRAVQKLEEELGGLLFRRERTLTHLTDLGRLMRPHLAQILAEAEQAKQHALGFAKLVQAKLSLGVMCTLGPTRLVAFLRAFQRANPGIEIRLRDATAQRLRDDLVAGEIDVALLAQPEPIDQEQFDARPLYDERFMIAFPPGHRFEAQASVAVRDLDGERYLSRVNCEYYDYLTKLCSEQGVHMTDPYSSEREDWIQGMIVAGLGVCFLPEHSVTVPQVRTRPVTAPEISRTVLLATVPGRRFSPPVAAFVRACTRHDWTSEV